MHILQDRQTRHRESGQSLALFLTQSVCFFPSVSFLLCAITEPFTPRLLLRTWRGTSPPVDETEQKEWVIRGEGCGGYYRGFASLHCLDNLEDAPATRGGRRVGAGLFKRFQWLHTDLSNNIQQDSMTELFFFDRPNQGGRERKMERKKLCCWFLSYSCYMVYYDYLSHAKFLT